jgi:hypothetical protein
MGFFKDLDLNLELGLKKKIFLYTIRRHFFTQTWDIDLNH